MITGRSAPASSAPARDCAFGEDEIERQVDEGRPAGLSGGGVERLVDQVGDFVGRLRGRGHPRNRSHERNVIDLLK
jgi:hypothetical protein